MFKNKAKRNASDAGYSAKMEFRGNTDKCNLFEVPVETSTTVW